MIEVGRVCVRSPHTAGKTAMAAVLMIWFALTRDGEDWKAPTTASNWRQLTKYLWPEIHKWSRRVKWDVVGRGPFKVDRELLNLSLKLTTGEAFALASSNPDAIEGAHATSIFYLFDEAKAIPEGIFDAAEGAFASPEGGEALGLAISTPGEPSGRFHDMQVKRDRYSDWWVRHWKLSEVIEAGRVGQSWVDKRKAQWGVDSPVYKNRVLGEFAEPEAGGIISLSWVERANDLWHETVPAPVEVVGVDVARFGDDKTCLSLGDGERVNEIRAYVKEDTMQTTGRVMGVLNANPGTRPVVDVLNMGAGVVDRLREQGVKVLAFHAGRKTHRTDRSGELQFANVRAAAWWLFREALEDGGIALPPDDDLTGELCAPRWSQTSTGRIKVESKDEIRKRLGRSTDKADAVIQQIVGRSLCESGVKLMVAKTRLR